MIIKQLEQFLRNCDEQRPEQTTRKPETSWKFTRNGTTTMKQLSMMPIIYWLLLTIGKMGTDESPKLYLEKLGDTKILQGNLVVKMKLDCGMLENKVKQRENAFMLYRESCDMLGARIPNMKCDHLSSNIDIDSRKIRSKQEFIRKFFFNTER